MKPVSEKKIGEWFDHHYGEKKWRSMREFSAYPVFLDYLQVQPGKSLLDVGCGPGWLLKAAREKGLAGGGVDLSPLAIALARQLAPEYLLVVASANYLPFPDHHFDYIACIGVLEHFVTPEVAIAEFRRVTRRSARLCIMVPNSETLYWRFMERMNRRHRESNENARSLEQWREFFKQHGLTINDIFRDEWRVRKFYMVLGLHRWQPLVRFTCSLLRRLVPLRGAHQFIFILQKAD